MSSFQLRNVYCNTNNNGKKRKLGNEDDCETAFCYIYEKKRRTFDYDSTNSNRVQVEPNSNNQINFKPENACLKPASNTFTLFSLCLTFIAKNVDFLDTLVDFPVQIGQLLFDECIKCSQFDLNHVKSEKLIKQRIRLFAQAYPENLIEQFKCSSKLEFIYLEPLINLCFITKLDLSKCDLMSMAAENDWNLSDVLKSSSDTLTHLNLSENNLNEPFVRKFTLPQRMRFVNFKKLSFLDLSLNPDLKLESNYLKYFLKFPDLNEMKISIKDLNVQNHFEEFKICKCNEQCQMTEIYNVGWITKINMKQIFDEMHQYVPKQNSADEYKSFMKQLRNKSENSNNQSEMEVGFLRRELSFYTKPTAYKNKDYDNKSEFKVNKDLRLATLKKDCKCFLKEHKNLRYEKIDQISNKISRRESIKAQESKTKPNENRTEIPIDLETVCGLIEKDQLLKYYA